MAEEVLFVQSRRAARVKRVQVAQHVVAAFVLASNGVDHLTHNQILGICEIAAAALLIGTVIVEKLRHKHESSTHVAWVELAGALMMFVEAADKARARHHALFYVLLFVQPLMLLMFALFDAQIDGLRYLKATDAGLELRMRILFRKRVPWSDVEGFRVTGNKIELGRRTLSLRDVVDRDAARAWIIEQLRQRGVEELPA